MTEKKHITRPDDIRRIERAPITPEIEAEIHETVSKFVKALKGKSDECWWCGESIRPTKKFGRSIYGACGCRLYQGDHPDPLE